MLAAADLALFPGKRRTQLEQWLAAICRQGPTIVWRNVSDFAVPGVEVSNPLEI